MRVEVLKDEQFWNFSDTQMPSIAWASFTQIRYDFRMKGMAYDKLFMEQQWSQSSHLVGQGQSLLMGRGGTPSFKKCFILH